MLNIDPKSENFNWLVAAALVLLIAVGVALSWRESSTSWQQSRWIEAHANAQRANEAWGANSFVPETKLLSEPSVKLTPAPPLPDQNEAIEFKPLPNPNQFGRRSNLQPPEAENSQAGSQFAPLPEMESIVTKALPSMDEFSTRPLPGFPATDTQDVLANHQEPIPIELPEKASKVEADSGVDQAAPQYVPLPPMESITTRALPPPVENITTHALPELPQAYKQDEPANDQQPSPVDVPDESRATEKSFEGIAEPAEGNAGEESQLKTWSLPLQEDIRIEHLLLPVNDNQTKVEAPATTELGFVKRLQKKELLPLMGTRQLNSPAPEPWNQPVEDGGVQHATVELELSGLKLTGAKESDTILGVPADEEPDSADPATEEPTALVAKLPKAPKGKKKKKKVVAAPKKGSVKKPASSKKDAKDDFLLAAQPKMGAHYIEDKPQTDQHAHLIEPITSDFSPDATNPYLPYEPHTQINVYQGKTLNANQRPLVELGRPWYQLGQLSPGSSVLGFHNNVTPQFLVFGDFRTGYASNRSNGDSTSQIAQQLNLDFDLKLTSTERFHAFFQPLSSNGRNTRRLLDDDEFEFEGSANPLFGYFEGDLGAIVGGAIGKTLPFDLPFTAGLIPLVFQNGVWFEDAILGVAATLPARNNARFNISNMDITFFAGYDKLDSPAFEGDDSAARIVGLASFLDVLNGYIEIDYAFLDDRTFADRSYHNIGIGYTRRYGRFLSNSTRVIVNAGQNSSVVDNTADGVLLLSENSLITGFPSNIVPYFNFFAGFDRPQSAARAAASGGVLRNTGILFESDNLTGFPTLDATANDTFGMALGLEVLSGGDRFSQQLVLEAAALGVMGNDATRNAAGDQYGVGFRYQLPLSNSVIFRADGMYGFLRNDEDISGIRLEVRKKF